MGLITITDIVLFWTKSELKLLLFLPACCGHWYWYENENESKSKYSTKDVPLRAHLVVVLLLLEIVEIEVNCRSNQRHALLCCRLWRENDGVFVHAC